MNVRFDVVDGAKIRQTKNLLEIVRPCLVEEIPIDCSVGATDPSVLLKAKEACPAQYSLHPNPLYPALLEDYDLRSVRSVDSVVVDLIYRLNLQLGNPNDPLSWVKTTAAQTYSTETFATAKGSGALLTYYQSGLGTGPNAPPNTAHVRIGKHRKIKLFKTMKVTGRMYYGNWLTYAGNLELAEGKINSDSWGSATRGQWLYLGAVVAVPIPTHNQSTNSLIATIELNFIKDVQGHFALLAYLNERREHPSDCVSEATLRALGLPALDAITVRNGKSLASIYDEIAFTGRFIFTP